MGLYDTFIPDPPIRCPRCQNILTGWQGKHENHNLYIWKQGLRSPIRQASDEYDEVWLRTKSLPDGAFYFNCGKCEECGFEYWPINLAFMTIVRDGVWCETCTDPPSVTGTWLDEELIQCPRCMNAWPAKKLDSIIVCKECQAVIRPPVATSE